MYISNHSNSLDSCHRGIDLLFTFEQFVQGGMRVYICDHETSPPGLLSFSFHFRDCTLHLQLHSCFLTLLSYLLDISLLGKCINLEILLEFPYLLFKGLNISVEGVFSNFYQTESPDVIGLLWNDIDCTSVMWYNFLSVVMCF